jgi:predicted PhzF superfamily epimerase YddE/YHI9
MVGRSAFDYLVELDSESAVRSLAPDMNLIAGIPYRGVIVTAPSEDPRYDFVSRFFAPGLGIPEDLVTGSAHCALGPYWGARLGKDEMVGYQASSRGGTVLVRLDGNRVHLGGQAVTVLRGEILH